MCQAQVYNYTGETGTYCYMAPEVYRHEPYNGKADVYRCKTFRNPVISHV